MNPIGFLKDLRFQFFYYLVTKTGIPLVTLGKINQWTFCDAGLNSQSNILCAGAGHDISFEKELIVRYGCQVVLLDPSPTGVATVREENIPPGLLRFMAIGVAGHDGILNFQNPEDAMEGSFRTAAAQAGGLQFSCKSLSTLMSELGWRHIDLLKIDIEGCEYGVIQEMLDKQLLVKQMCVEFHYGPLFDDHRRAEMIGSILALRRVGYELVHHVHRDHTFLLKSSI